MNAPDTDQGQPVTTQTGIPIIDCGTCGRRHPETRTHCTRCGKATLFGHDECEAPR